jgi:hypothetical protein
MARAGAGMRRTLVRSSACGNITISTGSQGFVWGMSITVPISIGEFVDKLIILRIKTERIRDPDRLANVRRELAILESVWAASPYRAAALEPEMQKLRSVNETLWDIEDRLRLKESQGRFDGEFIALARSVYRNNDERAALIRSINVRLGSDLIGEKSYTESSA